MVVHVIICVAPALSVTRNTTARITPISQPAFHSSRIAWKRSRAASPGRTIRPLPLRNAKRGITSACLRGHPRESKPKFAARSETVVVIHEGTLAMLKSLVSQTFKYLLLCNQIEKIQGANNVLFLFVYVFGACVCSLGCVWSRASQANASLGRISVPHHPLIW